MEVFVQQLINGLTLGSIYGLIAIGYTMVFGIIGMVNFAHGDVFMLSAFIALIFFLILTTWIGMSSVALALLIVMVIAMVITALWGWAIERIAYRPLRGSFRLAPLISAIGVSIFLANFVQVAQGARNKPTPPMIRDVIVLWQGESGYAVALSYKQIIIMISTAVLLSIFWYIVQKTSLGRAQRACEQDRKMAALLGIDVDRTISLTFVIGAALAAVAGTMYLLYYGVVSFADGFVNDAARVNAPLQRVSELVDWSAVEALLSDLRSGSLGAPAYPSLALFKALLLQPWYGLSDPGLEEALVDRFGAFWACR